MTDGTMAEADLPEKLGKLAWDLTVLGAKPLGPQDPEVVGGYRIHALLGVGGMGRVYLGRPVEVPADTGRAGAGSWFAVKVIRPDLADDAEFRERFARELDAAGRVDTRYAARLVGGEADVDQPWMATEFVAGVPLGEAVGPGEALPASSVWRLAHDVGSALIAVHRGGIVHRDVKPSNVILGTTGAKVIDFGVACSVDLAQVTATGLNVGTPSFMAPEQAQAGEVSSACDMFSLGVLLYFAVSGKLPFGQGVASASAVLFRVVYQEPDLAGLEGVEPSLRHLIVRCLAKDPLERPSAMGLVALAKAAAIDGLWDEAEGVEWPPALSARIWERTHTAGRAVPRALLDKTASAKAVPLPAVAPNATAILPKDERLTAEASEPALPEANLPEAVLPDSVPPEYVPPEVGVLKAVAPAAKALLSETVVFESARSGAAPRPARDSGMVPVGRAGAESSVPKPGGGRRRAVVFAGAAAVSVVVVGVAAMFVWGNGGGGNTAGNQAGAGGESIGAMAGLAGSSSSGAAVPGSGSAAARSGASASARPSDSAATGTPGWQVSQSPDSSAGGGSPSVGASDPGPPSGSPGPPPPSPSRSLGPPPPPTTTPPNTGCTGWSEQHIGSGMSQAGPGHAPSIFSGPYSDCSPVGPPVAHGDKLALWCYVVNATGATWSYVQDTQKNSYGWIPNIDLAGGTGASDHC